MSLKSESPALDIRDWRSQTGQSDLSFPTSISNGGISDLKRRVSYCTVPKNNPSGVAGAVNCFTTFSVSGSSTLTCPEYPVI